MPTPALPTAAMPAPPPLAEQRFYMLDTRVTRPVAAALAPGVRVLRGHMAGALRGIAARDGIVPALAALRRAIRSRHRAQSLVAGNLYRKQVRLPRLFCGAVLRIYGAVKTTEARLVRDYLDRTLPRATGCSGADANRGLRAIAVIFNGSNFPESVLADVAAAHGLPRVFTEAGFLPGTMQVDARGLNAANSVPRDPAFYLHAGADFAAAGLPDAIGRRAPKRGRAAPVSLPARYVFVPFQVPSDMQVRLHSPWIRSMEQFLEVLVDMARRCPDKTFVIKEHPSFRRAVDRGGRTGDRVIFANDNDTADLIAGAEAVVTLNSTVGFEALVMDRPVIVLGAAHYAVADLVLRAGDAAALQAALTQVPGWRPDPRLRRQFLGYVRNRYLVPGTFDRPDPRIADHITARAAPADPQDAAHRSAGPLVGPSFGR